MTVKTIIPELDERMQDLKNELESFENEGSEESHRTKAVDALKRMENWNLFSESYEVSTFAKLYSVTSMRRLNYCCCFDIVFLSEKISSSYSSIVSFTWYDEKS